VTGPVTPVLAAAAKDGAEDIVARPADLDELFLTFYADKEPSHDA
jgi:ABC-2 type transport system ATP-binding protein